MPGPNLPAARISKPLPYDSFGAALYIVTMYGRVNSLSVRRQNQGPSPTVTFSSHMKNMPGRMGRASCQDQTNRLCFQQSILRERERERGWQGQTREGVKRSACTRTIQGLPTNSYRTYGVHT
ncbi:hypothetical protein CGRA01v4_04357 [Colletotrichum graminicola]|nr:hypothetical protein CGRA01v4_04357 [Colletotrichum graminicola]